MTQDVQAYASKPQFDQPWLLKEFDQIQFYEVDQAEFDTLLEQFKTGRYTLTHEDTVFEPKSYSAFLDSIADETAQFVARRNAAGKAVTSQERELLAAWRDAQVDTSGPVGDVDEGGIEVISPMTSSVWKVQVSPGDVVKEGQVLVILEAMKMEIRE